MQTVGNIVIRIPEWHRSSLDAKVIMYQVTVQKKGTEDWILEYRYSQFDDLNKGLKKLYPNLPSLPGKSIFKLSEENQLEERRAGLEQYLQQLCTRQDIFNSESLKQFLQIDKHAAETIITPPKLLGEITGFIHGVRDFLYIQQKGILFILSGDMNVASRMDAYLTNTKMPWEKEAPPTLLSVGSLECWVKAPGGGEGDDFKFERAWNKSYPLQGICMFWENKTQTLFVGMDEGQLDIMRLPEDVNFLRYEDVCNDKLHEERIMGIYHNTVTNTTYTVSEDKSLRTSMNGKVQNVVKHSSSGLTALQGDTEYKRLFVTNRSGNVFIYDISSGNPTQLNVLTTSEKGVLRGLQVDTIRNYLFSGGYDNGEIAIFNLDTPGKEKFVKQVSSLKGKANARFIEWSTGRKEVFVGCKDGTITIWNAQKAQPIFVLKAHVNDITKLQWLEKQNILITSSKEKVLKYWHLPKEWRKKDLQVQEEKEFESSQKEKNVDRAVQQIRIAEQDSDDDDLLGWHKD